MPSLLERLIDKARLIADMMHKMQTRTRDGNLRSIDQKFDLPKSKVTAEGLREDILEAKALKYQPREEGDAKPSFLLTLQSSLSGGSPSDLVRVDSKQRGMSDVDSTNIMALKDNTSSMIDLSLSRIKSTHSKIQDQSPSPRKRGHDEEETKKEDGASDDDEFYDALDDEKDLKLVD